MQTALSDVRTKFIIALSFILCLGVVPTLAQNTMKIAGEISATAPPADSLFVGDTAGHLLSLGELEGLNKSTGEQLFMDGGMYNSWGFSDYVQGTGSHEGYGRFTQNDAVVFTRHEGKTTTTISESGKAVATFEGRFSFIKGAGKYENIQGGGTYKGRLTGPEQWTAEWEGSYSLKK